MDMPAFIVASLVLLATPGPTNTLLFASGASAGLRPSLPLLLAELSGYLLAINLLVAALGPLIAGHSGVRIVLQAASAAYLVHAARGLWVNGARGDGEAVGFGKLFVTTLLNPKAIVFATAIIPAGAPFAERLPWLAGLGLMIAGVGVGWIAAGATIRSGWAGGGALVCRLGAAALTGFAALMSWSAVASAFGL